MYTRLIAYLVFFFFNDTATTEIYTLSLHTLFRSLHPRGIDAEFIAGSAIMIRIQEQPDHVGGREVVAPGEHRDDAVGVRIEGADENVQVGRVVGDFRLGRELGRVALAGPPLLKSGNRLGLPPHGIVGAPVNDGRLSGTGDEIGRAHV